MDSLTPTDNGRYVAGHICVGVAAHKAYRMPSDPMYLPLHVGKALHPKLDLGFQGDDTGDNISNLNAQYSELTGLYWLWKNCNAPYKGLVHYRRHFATSSAINRLKAKDRFDRIITCSEMQTVLSQADIVLPKKRNYVIETIYSHYAHTLDAKQLDETRKILGQKEPEYLKAFDSVMHATSAHMFNMFVMERTKFDEYCSWLFPILKELERRISSDAYDAFGARYPGRVSELLLDVWIKTKAYDYIELPVVSPEPVNWWKKGLGFLMAKFGGKKYAKSF